MNFRTAENVRVPSFSFRSLRFVSFWFGQLIVPASLSPSFLIVRVDVSFTPPISYSQFHVPTGSALSPCAPARLVSPSTNVAERIAFMIASKEWRAGSCPTPTGLHPPTGIQGMPRPLVGRRNLESLCNQGVSEAELRGHSLLPGSVGIGKRSWIHA